MPKCLLFIILITLFSCKQQDTYFTKIAKNDVQLSAPEYGDWLYKHKEKGQKVAAYKTNKPVDKQVMYLLPLGTFTPSQQQTLAKTRAYLEIFFQRKTLLLPTVADTDIIRQASRMHENQLQLLAPFVLNKLQLPADGLAMMAISAQDLYPKEDWNYVFGLASYSRRVGVTSVFRLDNGDSTTCLRRLSSISSHEIGHMLSLAHCIHARCVMNGTNGLRETDNCPLRLCSECQEKLQWYLQYDNAKRLQQLSQYCKENGLLVDKAIFQRDIMTAN